METGACCWLGHGLAVDILFRKCHMLVAAEFGDCCPAKRGNRKNSPGDPAGCWDGPQPISVAPVWAVWGEMFHGKEIVSGAHHPSKTSDSFLFWITSKSLPPGHTGKSTIYVKQMASIDFASKIVSFNWCATGGLGGAIAMPNKILVSI